MNFRTIIKKMIKQKNRQSSASCVFTIGKVSSNTLGYGQYGWEGQNDPRPHACFKQAVKIKNQGQYMNFKNFVKKVLTQKNKKSLSEKVLVVGKASLTTLGWCGKGWEDWRETSRKAC